MKHARKLASLLLALVMVFALAVTAFATETGATTTGTITVANPVEGQTYTAYKIFDVTYDGDNYSYTIAVDGSNPWLLKVRYYAAWPDKGLEEHIAGTPIEQKPYYTINDKFSPADFAAYLKGELDKNPTGYTGYELTKQGNVASVSGLPLGYYFVASSSGALCNLTTTNPEVTIHDKNDMPFEKTADQTDVEVGQTVNYTITGKVPDYTGFDEYTYLITDTMSEGLTFKKDVKVTVDGADVTTACIPTYDVEKNANKFTVSIPVKSYPIGKEILVTYSAVVNENAVAVVSKNKAELTYSNNPTDKTSKATKPAEEHEVYSAKIVIDKYETDNENKKLDGAEFVLYKEERPAGAEEATKLYYKWNDTAQKVEWIANKDQATVKETGKDGTPGAASFDGLADGTYYLVETKAPAGYNQLTGPKEVTVAGSTTDTTKLTVTEKVANQAGTLLPSTGGMGTTIFYVLGAVLVVGAGVLLVTKKRMSQSEI